MSLLSLFTPLEKGQQHFVSVSYESLTGQGIILVPSRFGSQKRELVRALEKYMLNTILLIIVICWLLYIEYKVLKRVNELDKKINDVSFISRQQTNTAVRTLIVYLRQKDILNDRQEKLLQDEIEMIHRKSELQLKGIYQSPLDEIFRTKK